WRPAVGAEHATNSSNSARPMRRGGRWIRPADEQARSGLTVEDEEHRRSRSEGSGSDIALPSRLVVPLLHVSLAANRYLLGTPFRASRGVSSQVRRLADASPFRARSASARKRAMAVARTRKG